MSEAQDTKETANGQSRLTGVLGVAHVSSIGRIWKGKKECAHTPYFCGQRLNLCAALWETVTAEFQSTELAEYALAEYLRHNVQGEQPAANETNEG